MTYKLRKQFYYLKLTGIYLGNFFWTKFIFITDYILKKEILKNPIVLCMLIGEDFSINIMLCNFFKPKLTKGTYLVCCLFQFGLSREFWLWNMKKKPRSNHKLGKVHILCHAGFEILPSPVVIICHSWLEPLHPPLATNIQNSN